MSDPQELQNRVDGFLQRLLENAGEASLWETADELSYLSILAMSEPDLSRAETKARLIARRGQITTLEEWHALPLRSVVIGRLGEVILKDEPGRDYGYMPFRLGGISDGIEPELPARIAHTP